MERMNTFIARDPDHRDTRKVTDSRPPWTPPRKSSTRGSTTDSTVFGVRARAARSSIHSRISTTRPSPNTAANGPRAPNRHSRSAGREISAKKADSAASPITRERDRARRVRRISSRPLWNTECRRNHASVVRQRPSQKPTTGRTLSGAETPPTGADASTSGRDPRLPRAGTSGQGHGGVTFSLHDRCSGPHAPRAPPRGLPAGQQRHLSQRRLVPRRLYAPL